MRGCVTSVTGVAATNTISVTGHGEELAVPDIATFNFSVVSDKPTVAAAQADATAKANAITTYLTGAWSSSSRYTNKRLLDTAAIRLPNQVCPQAVAPTVVNGASGSASSAVYCGGSNQVLKGYEVSQSTTVKVRDTSKAGTLLTGCCSNGATNVSGLTFTFDDPTAVHTDARNKAIADAKSKAQALASQLAFRSCGLSRLTKIQEVLPAATHVRTCKRCR